MINGHTRILGVIGDPITHSKSPQMHNTMLEHLGLNMVYVPFHVHPNNLNAAVQGLKALDIAGFNVTVPHKETILPYLDDCDDDAKKIGAVNTIVNKNGHLIGYNTDGKGFLYAFTKELGQSITHQRIACIGAGGTARALCMTCLNQNPASLTIINRSSERALTLINELKQHYPESSIIYGDPKNQETLTALNTQTIVLNTTPLGMYPHEDVLPISDMSWVTQNHICFDVIYTPEETAFLRESKNKGAKIMNGSAMLASQAAFAFEHFTGKKASFQAMFDRLNTLTRS